MNVGTLMLLMVVFCSAAGANGQEPPVPDTLAVDTAAVDVEILSADTTVADSVPPLPTDTVRYVPSGALDRFLAPTDTVNLEAHLSQNPTTALFKSMVVPGWGQFGNGDIFKGVVFLGLDAWMVGSAIHYGLQASDFKDKFEAATTVSERNEWYSPYEDRRSERNKFTWFAVIVSFVAMFDAYVDAHFSGFPDAGAGEGITFDAGPDSTGGVAASITVPF
jgi:hypothetical protein